MSVKPTNPQNRMKFVLTIGTAVIASCSSLSSALAATNAQPPADSQKTSTAQDNSAFDPEKLAAAEKLYFGSSFEQLPVEQRMDKIERGVFGHNRGGSLSKRFDRVSTALGAQNHPGSSSTPVVSDSNSKLQEHNELKSESRPVNASTSEAKQEPKSDAPQELKPEDKIASTANKSENKKTDAPEQPITDARVQGLLKSGMAAHRSGQSQAAEGQFKAALAIDPRCADAFYNLGSIAESKGDLLSALTNYRAALGINPLDREFQNAVKAVEDDVAKGRATAGNANLMPKVAPPFNAGKYQGASYPGVAPTSADNKLWNLQTAQSNALMQAQGNYPLGNVSQPPIPVYNVSQQTAPAQSVNQQKAPSHNNSATNAMVNVLMQASGLHCPICRLRSLGNW